MPDSQPRPSDPLPNLVAGQQVTIEVSALNHIPYWPMDPNEPVDVAITFERSEDGRLTATLALAPEEPAPVVDPRARHWHPVNGRYPS